MQKVDAEQVKKLIKDKIIDFVPEKFKHITIKYDDVIPELGILDSLGIIQLISWYEAKFEIKLAQSEINLDNFGTIDAMAKFFLNNKLLVSS